MIGVIYAAGYGSRLFPLTLDKPRSVSRKKGIPEDCFNINAMPKPLAPVTNYPVIYSALSKMKSLGVEKVIITVWHLSDVFFKHAPKMSGLEVILDKRASSSSDDYFQIMSRLYSGGYIGDCIWMGADIISSLDLRPALEAHLKQKPLATIVTTPVRGHENRFSAIETPEQQTYEPVTGFQYKTTMEQAKARKRDASVYFFSQDFFSWLTATFPDLPRLNFSRDIFSILVKESFFCYKTTDFWEDIGELDTYLNIQNKVLNREAHHPIHGRFYVDQRTYNEGHYTVIGPSLIQEDCEMGIGTVIGPNTVIGKGWRIGRDSWIQQSVLWPNHIGEEFCNCFVVGNNISINYCIAGSGNIQKDSNNKTIVYNGEATAYLHFK